MKTLVLEAVPLVGVGPLKFGATREEILSALDGVAWVPWGPGRERDLVCLEGGLKACLSEAGALVFVEVCSSSSIRLEIGGLVPLSMRAWAAVDALEDLLGEAALELEAETDYEFPGAQVSLWRECGPMYEGNVVVSAGVPGVPGFETIGFGAPGHFGLEHFGIPKEKLRRRRRKGPARIDP